jgi:uncharacterized OB-fold protein
VSVAEERKIPAPVTNAENAPYFEAAAKEKLLVKHCAACARFHAYPRALCPYCFNQTEWREAKGTGTVYSYSVMRRGVPIPYAIAYVALDEGVTILANVVDCGLDDIRIGARVRVVFKASDGGAVVPMFALA